MDRLRLAIKYWLQGDDWRKAWEYAGAITAAFRGHQRKDRRP